MEASGRGQERSLTRPGAGPLGGRLRGRLRPRQKELLARRLPQLSVSLPDTAPPGRLEPAGLFAAPPARVWLEIGFGAGEHLAAQAVRRPGAGIIGCEVYRSGIARLLAAVDRLELDNVRIYEGDARSLLPALAPACLDRVFALFPDPWPKARHHKRRLVCPKALDQLGRVMRPGAELRLATDCPDHAHWCLHHLCAHEQFCAPRGGAVLPLRPAWPATRYEHKARQAGRAVTWLVFHRRQPAS